MQHFETEGVDLLADPIYNFVPDWEKAVPEIQDSHELRAKILALTSSQAKSIGIDKSTFHYLRQRAVAAREFKIYSPVLSKLSR